MTPCQVIEQQEVKATMIKEDTKNLRCVSNCEDTTFDMDALLIDSKLKDDEDEEEEEEENMEIDVVGCCTDGGRYLGKEEHGDDGTDYDDDDDGAEEYSSSFGNTCSDDNEDGSRLSDNEVDSSFYGGSSLFEGFDSLFPLNKKKVTDHWKRYVSPLTWRGKWLELRMKAMKSQLSKYERELESYGRKEQELKLGQCTSGECSMKLLPFSRQNQRKEVMKRRKRKKIEDMVDVSSYMSQHNLFSYYENNADFGSVDDDSSIHAIAAAVNNNDDLDICTSLEVRDDNSMEYVLWKIQHAQFRVQKIRTQIDKLLTENAAKFSSVESLTELELELELAHSDDPTCSPRSPGRAPIKGETVPNISCSPPQQLADHPDTVQSSHGEAAPLPEIMGCSSVPPSEEARLDQSYFVGPSQNVVNDVAQKQEVKRESPQLEKLGGPPPIVNCLVEVEVEVKLENGTDLPPTSHEANITRQNSIKKSCLPPEIIGPSTKRKRGERKASPSTWNADVMVTLSDTGKQMLTSVNQ